jgi:hypothetical protein
VRDQAVITPETPERSYSTRLRTALVLSGSGTAGAYHAGVLRALHEAGVRVDLVAGRGMGAVSAMFAAVDGGARLWEPTGIWKSRLAPSFYRWRAALQVAGWAFVASGMVLLFPAVLFAGAILVGLAGFALTLIGLDQAGSALTIRFTTWLGALFAPPSLPTVVPRLVLFAVLVAFASLAASLAAQRLTARARRRRTARRGPDVVWRLVGTPLSSSRTFEAFAAELWKLIRGAAPLQQPRNTELARRYVELLTENLGQPGFRELLVVSHDLDARHDLVFAFLTEQHRSRFFSRAIASGQTARGAEAFDLAGVAREHAMDVLSASLAVPIATEPHLVTFAPEGPWRGESHRLCDRPASLARVLEEVAAAGAEQVVLLSASPRAGRPHELTANRADLRGSAGEQLGAFESAGLRDVIEQFAGRFAGLYLIRPDHNPIGPLDFAGTFDERSDRRYTLAELVDRGYEDAYRHFIDPVVGASGERIQSVSSP